MTLHLSDLEDDIAIFLKERLPNVQINNVFDVGANIGWFSLCFLTAFADARIWAFEPVTTIRAEMLQNLARFEETKPFPRTSCLPYALGASNGLVEITSYPGVTINKIRSDKPANVPLESVHMLTGDDFCRTQLVQHIDFLKIDTEGYDLEVLKGFRGLITQGAIDFIQVEAGMIPGDPAFVGMTTLLDFMLPLGYRLFRFSNQASGREIPVMERADVVFISTQAAERYRFNAIGSAA